MNNGDNNGYTLKPKNSSKSKNNAAGKSPFEVRTDLIKLSLELHLSNATYGDSKQIEAVDVVKTADVFNSFISRKNETN